MIACAPAWLSDARTSFFSHPVTVMLSILAIALQAADLFKARSNAPTL